ncbi:MAG TPA: redoxin domain-containing protein [Pyrinomonadaceae bacterium]|jgi:peroxiredoxin
MDIVLLFSRWILTAVFGLAAAGKLTDRAGTLRAIKGFGVPGALAIPLGWLLPLAELLVALALLFSAYAWLGALGALALLLLFIAGIGINLARGKAPDCHCFGQIHSAPVGPSILLRNLGLASLAAFVIWQGKEDAGPDAFNWLRGLSNAERAQVLTGLLILGLLACITALLVQIFKQQKQMLLRLEDLEMGYEGAQPPVQVREDLAPITKGLPVGAPAPAFSLHNLSGVEISLSALLADGKFALLVFVSPGCGPCASLVPEIKRWQSDYAQKMTVALISRDQPEANRAKFAELDQRLLLLQADSEVSNEYQARWTPAAVIVTPEGAIGSQLALGVETIRSLVEHTVSNASARPWLAAHSQHDVHQQASHPTPSIGAPAPSFKLPDLSGQTIELDQFRGHRTLLLFWNPDCVFCQQMLDDLRDFEREPPPNAPVLLFISTGTPEANRAMNLASPVLLDQDFKTGSAYGATGTPSAILLDAEGRIASVMAAGAPDVLALCGMRERQVESALAG